MNADKQKAMAESSRRSPFWVCFVVFALLACDYGYRVVNVLDQREQLNQAALAQAQHAGDLAEARKLEARIEAFSLELLQVAKTNAVARQITQDFNIQWNPAPAAPVAGPAAGIQPK
jgi:hypothetical protein